jgi:hypothetical protein
MSELAVSTVSFGTAVVVPPLLVAAGVALVAALAISRLVNPQLVGVNTMAQGFIRDAQQARERLLTQLATPATSQVGTAPAFREAAEALARVQAIREAYAKQPILTLVAEAHRGQTLQTAAQEISQAQAAFQRQDLETALQMAEQAEKALAEAAQEALERLQKAQRQVVAEQARRALSSLGYRVEEASNGQATAFRARAGEHVLGVVVLDGGKLLVDTAGFVGTSCRAALNAFYRRLRDQGIQVHPEASLVHQRRDGGPLLVNNGRGAQGLLQAVARLQAQKNPAPAQEVERERAAVWVWAQRQQVG